MLIIMSTSNVNDNNRSRSASLVVVVILCGANNAKYDSIIIIIDENIVAADADVSSTICRVRGSAALI